jgi:hypothetical protein
MTFYFPLYESSVRKYRVPVHLTDVLKAFNREQDVRVLRSMEQFNVYEALP